MDDLLKDFQDAQAVRETSSPNAKLALEEASPIKLQNMSFLRRFRTKSKSMKKKMKWMKSVMKKKKVR